MRSDLNGLIAALAALESEPSETAEEDPTEDDATEPTSEVGETAGTDGVSGSAPTNDQVNAQESHVLGPRAAVARVIADGRTGRERIPGKHGEPVTRYAVVTALLPDAPGQLARLFNDIGAAGINVEEFGLEHSPGQKVGLAGVSVLPAARAALERALIERGWHVVA
jgi:prephenate dehydrogenase